MHTSCFEVMFTIHDAFSLKEKRMVVKSIKERCRNRFNVSVVECGENDKWKTGKLGFALAAINAHAAQQNTQNIIEYLYDDDRIEVMGIEKY